MSQGRTLEEGRRLILHLTKVLDDRMTVAGHPYALVQAEHLGTCSVRECSARCHQYRALFVAAEAWLETNAEAEPVQTGLFSEVAG